MASIVLGYEYDIFISYRQKDNKYDGWVSEFVTNLKKELEATFKEDISIYFDENPNDGLLETYNVDKSLEGKLKCLIFIPVISQTYCDTKSFAWTREFCAFNKIAQGDQFGRDIKLGSGNVASRILPVKIHDLDTEDEILLENELGGVLRSIEFIFKSSGINRPLKPNDERAENINRIYYRDQINKVANAVKEIIRGIGQPADTPKEYRSAHSKDYSDETQKNLPEITIAVLPFTDMSSAGDQEYLGDGLADELLTILSQIKELKVTGRSSSFSFKDKNLDLTTIGKVLNVKNILEGSIQKAENRVRITAQLINAEDGFHIWSQRYDRKMDDIFGLQDDICTKISEHLKVMLLTDQKTEISKRPTNNSEAYELYLKGDFYCKKYSEEGFERSIEYFKKAIELDPVYADAWWYLGFVNYQMHGWLYLQKEKVETAIYCANKAIEVDESNAYGHFLIALIHFTYDYDWEKVETEIGLGNKYLRTSFPPTFSFSLEPWYRAMLFGDFEFAVSRLLKGVENDPLNFYYQFHLAQIYLYGVHDYKKTISILNNILELDFPKKQAWRPMCLSYLFEEKYVLAEDYARMEYDASGGKGYGAAHLIMCLASSGKNEAALQLYKSVKETLSPAQFPFFLHSQVNIYLGNRDEAFAYLDRAITERNYMLFTLKYSPEWDPIRSDLRFESVLERMNFPK
jgi:TolB-like protein/tetratricopeptide (TPR) repeat protein